MLIPPVAPPPPTPTQPSQGQDTIVHMLTPQPPPFCKLLAPSYISSNMNNAPKGLVNLGNTCYFNSIMQVLLNAPLFGQLLEEHTSSTDNRYILGDPNSDKPIELELPECDFAVKSLVELYQTYTSGKSNQSVTPSKHIDSIRKKTGRFQRLVQEDSHELLRALLDIIRSDEIRRQKAAIAHYLGDNNKSQAIKADVFTVIDMIFGGYFLSSVKCEKCKYKSQHLEPFFDISLAITDPVSDLRSALANFTSNAILDGDNKFICDRCSKTNGQKTYEAGVKSTTIAVPPVVLTLHLKRFESSGGIEIRGLGGGRRNKNSGGGGGGGRRKRGKNRGGDDDDDDHQIVCGRGGGGGVNFRKINKHIEFAELLDLSDYTSDLCYDLTKINKWPRLNRGDPIWYSLFGVVCHSGSLRGGHYTAFVRVPQEDSDSCLDDLADFIQKTPYLYELADIDKLRDYIKQHDSIRCETTSRYREEDDGELIVNENSDYYDKPKSSPGNWYHISDNHVSKSNLASVLSSQAYILFYRRVIKQQ